MNKKILFITGTRADFGKLKPIISKSISCSEFEIFIFVTGMHMLSKYGYTFEEVKSNFLNNSYGFVNQNQSSTIDEVLSKSILGLSDFVRELKPDLIVIHGDRVEALSGAIVGSFNNILVAHIEGGEISGTIDDSIRHAVTKFSHIHFVSNNKSRDRLIRMGEKQSTIFIVGSPEYDIMTSNNLPSLELVKSHYGIPFEEYSIVLFHPVTSEIKVLERDTLELVEAINESKKHYIVIMPNNDPGTEIIQKVYENNLDLKYCKYFPSIRFEYFITLLKNARILIGNSSAGIREAPFFGIPSINIGTRQNGRTENKNIINISSKKSLILDAIHKASSIKLKSGPTEFSLNQNKKSAEKIINILLTEDIWKLETQKYFKDDGSN